MHPNNQDFLVVGTIEYTNLPALGKSARRAPEKVMLQLVSARLFEAGNLASLRIDPGHDGPDRIASDLRFDVLSLKHLDFSPPDLDKFPCLRLAYEAVEAGGAKTVALNAADEVAVGAFLEGQIPFLGIPATIQAVLNETPTHKP